MYIYWIVNFNSLVFLESQQRSTMYLLCEREYWSKNEKSANIPIWLKGNSMFLIDFRRRIEPYCIFILICYRPNNSIHFLRMAAWSFAFHFSLHGKIRICGSLLPPGISHKNIPTRSVPILAKSNHRQLTLNTRYSPACLSNLAVTLPYSL